jgi:hypothetical protein
MYGFDVKSFRIPLCLLVLFVKILVVIVIVSCYWENEVSLGLGAWWISVLQFCLKGLL